MDILCYFLSMLIPNLITIIAMTIVTIGIVFGRCRPCTFLRAARCHSIREAHSDLQPLKYSQYTVRHHDFALCRARIVLMNLAHHLFYLIREPHCTINVSQIEFPLITDTLKTANIPLNNIDGVFWRIRQHQQFHGHDKELKITTCLVQDRKIGSCSLLADWRTDQLPQQERHER